MAPVRSDGGGEMSDYTTTNTTSLTLEKFNMEPVMTIHPDGRVTISDKFQPDEAAAKVVEAFKTQWMADVQATKIRELQERIRLLIAERDTARRQADQNWKLREEFRELLGTDDVEQGVAVVREMNERIKRLEDIIEKASKHFRRAGPNAFTAYEMADVLKEAKP